MPKKPPRTHLEIQTSRKSPVGILRTTFWDKEAQKYRHEQKGRITGKTLEELKTIQAAMRGDVVVPTVVQSPRITKSRELGASQAILSVIKSLGLAKLIYSKKEAWVGHILAMIVGRLIFSQSKLGLCNLWEETCLWELCGVEERPSVQKHCYLDRLSRRQRAIQKGLVAKHMGATRKNEELPSSSERSLLLYDITSTYFEGDYEESEIVRFGYNRDRKKGTKQVVIGLICTAEGCPLAVEVYKGNTKDDSTVIEKVQEMRELYGIKKYTFVGDRGMLTSKNLEQLAGDADLTTITALTHGNMKSLLDAKVIQPELFDEKNIGEIQDPEDSSVRYCLCKNPESAKRETKTRARLIALTVEALEEVQAYKHACTVEKLGARVGRILEKYKMGKFVEWHIDADAEQKSNAHRLKWEIRKNKVEAEQLLDGCYVIRTDVPPEAMNSQEAVEGYKSLGNIERAFRNLKTVSLEMRPVYHKKDERIEAHIFLCMLAYYVQWHMHRAWMPIYEADGVGQEREHTFDSIIESLKSIQSSTMVTGGINYEIPTDPNQKQQNALELLKNI